MRCATREVFEKTGLIIDKLEHLAITNDIFSAEQKHYVSILMKAQVYTIDQEIVVKEPHKISSLRWFPLSHLSKDLFSPLKN